MKYDIEFLVLCMLKSCFMMLWFYFFFCCIPWRVFITFPPLLYHINLKPNFNNESFILCSVFFIYITDPAPTINEFIRHWEPAHFDRASLELAHQTHERNRRKKRDINYNHYSPQYGSTNVLKFQFSAHDR